MWSTADAQQRGSPTDPVGSWREGGSGGQAEVRPGVVVNENGEAARAHLRILATGWQRLTGELNWRGTAIHWANGTVWTRDHGGWDVAGEWYYAGNRRRPCWIEPRGDRLSLTNELGETASGRLQIVADGWSDLVGTVTSREIWWENGTQWARERGGRRSR